MEHWAAKKKKKKRKKKTEEEAENQFSRLPDDVVLNIFDKIPEIESLCRCFLVSKRFSCLISRVQTVSVKRILSKYGALVKLPKDSPPGLYESGVGFLPVFTQIRSLNLEIVSHFHYFKGNNGSVFKWGAQFTTKHHGVTLIYAETLSKMKEAEEENQNMITWKRLIRRSLLGQECIYYAAFWLATLSHVVEQHPTLQSIRITDPDNKGVKLCLCGEKLGEFRIALDLDKVLRPWMLENRRVGYVPVLQLPTSRYVMKGVTIVNCILYGDDDTEADSAMLDAFGEEQGVFLEAMVQILKNHKDVIKAFNFYDQN
ncbi:hypothetical protein RHMOL_Rhmol13G0281700 [Rhododendron molle]|uniref:Uncharacterized protein n=1 Tax=Rhododendron molle TaxID=49168 RepID=A0ACC0LCV4_RHOML|nr:hypothetical protein RHMOL_Rhmol13G0281700 [Rhododendron molle]